MANLDLTPLYRSSVGFDRLPRLLQTASQVAESEPDYPPYDIEKLSDDDYRIVVALAGFAADDLEIQAEQNQLTVRGKMMEREGVNYLHRGISGRSFERKFELAEFIEVDGAKFDNGLLTIELKRRIPDRLKPRQIEIGSDTRSRPAKKNAA